MKKFNIMITSAFLIAVMGVSATDSNTTVAPAADPFAAAKAFCEKEKKMLLKDGMGYYCGVQCTIAGEVLVQGATNAYCAKKLDAEKLASTCPSGKILVQENANIACQKGSYTQCSSGEVLIKNPSGFGIETYSCKKSEDKDKVCPARTYRKNGKTITKKLVDIGDNNYRCMTVLDTQENIEALDVFSGQLDKPYVSTSGEFYSREKLVQEVTALDEALSKCTLFKKSLLGYLVCDNSTATKK